MNQSVAAITKQAQATAPETEAIQTLSVATDKVHVVEAYELLGTEELQQRIRSLNSKAGQIKMDLHDLAEGLPSDFEQLPELANRTYELFALLDRLRRRLRSLEASSQSTGP